MDVRLTLDLNLQRRADSLLADSLGEDAGGAIVLMNAQSGEILTMSSFPYFDATNLASEWAILSEDPSAPLLNRAAQGKYHAGPALLPFMAASDIDLLLNFPNPDELIKVSLVTQTCAFPLRGQLTWNALITNGCHESQRELASIMNSPSLLALFEGLGFYNGPKMYIEVAEGISPPSEPDPLTAIETMQISPLQAAIAASTLTNQGIRPGPRIVNAYQDPQGDWITLPKLESNENILAANQAGATTELLKTPAASIWEVTANTETDEGKVITWFLGGTTQNWQRQPLVVVVLLEKNAPEAAKEIGNALLEEAMNISNTQQ